MNVKEINQGTYETLANYIVAAILLTLITVWSIVALQSDSRFHGPNKGIGYRLCWPVLCLKRKWDEKRAQAVGHITGALEKAE